MKRLLFYFLCVSVLYLFTAPLMATPKVSNREVNRDTMIGYIPADVALVNPPPISWVPEPEAEGGTWNLQVARSGNKFASPDIDVTTKWLMYTHSAPLTSGKYEWRYRFTTKSGETSDWSTVRSFTIPENTPQCPRPATADLAKNIPSEHPHAFVRPEDLPALRNSTKTMKEDFTKLLDKADNALTVPIMAAPEPWEGGEWNTPQWLKYLRQITDTSKAMENLAFTYMITGEKKYGIRAKEQLLNMTTWDTGTSSPSGMLTNDELTMGIIWGGTRTYSWIHDLLSEPERQAVRDMIKARCEDGMKNKLCRPDSHFEQYAFDSYNGRIWHLIGEAGIVFYNEIPEAKVWLDYALTIFYGWYPAWGDREGGWSEGMHYFCSYNELVTTWLEEMKMILKCNPANKPVYQNIGWQAYYLTPPGGALSAFGDFGENNPPIQRGRVLAYYAQMTDNGYWQWFADKVGLGDYQGWSTYLAAFRPKPAPIPPKAKTLHHVLPTAGFATIMSDYTDPDNNVQLTMRAGPRGNLSHTHQDQGAIILGAFGDQVLCNTGLRDAYASKFCKEWYWNTKAHNALLFDNREGQPRTPKAKAAFVKNGGKDNEPFHWLAADLTGAYSTQADATKRLVGFDNGKVIVVLTATQPKAQSTTATLAWHARVPFIISQKDNSFTAETTNTVLWGKTFTSWEANVAMSQTDQYSMEPEPQAKPRKEWHLWQDYTMPKDGKMLMMATVFDISKKGKKSEISNVKAQWDTDTATVSWTVAGKSQSMKFNLKDNTVTK